MTNKSSKPGRPRRCRFRSAGRRHRIGPMGRRARRRTRHALPRPPP